MKCSTKGIVLSTKYIIFNKYFGFWFICWFWIHVNFI